jgi:hypothetical protein
MILGADNSDPTDEELAERVAAAKAVLKQRRTVAARKAAKESGKLTGEEVTSLMDYFNFASRKAGSNAVPTCEAVIFRTKLRQMSTGLSMRSIKANIDSFFSLARNREHPAPWRVFVMTKVQADLLQQTGATPKTVDPVLAWVSDDFTRTGDLPWEQGEDNNFRRILLANIMLMYRYPEVVAQVVTEHSSEDSSKILDDLHNFVAAVLASEDTRSIRSSLTRYGVHIPTSMTNPRTVRPVATTLAEAIVRSQR